MAYLTLKQKSRNAKNRTVFIYTALFFSFAIAAIGGGIGAYINNKVYMVTFTFPGLIGMYITCMYSYITE